MADKAKWPMSYVIGIKNTNPLKINKKVVFKAQTEEIDLSIHVARQNKKNA